MQWTADRRAPTIVGMSTSIPCVLMRAGTSRGPFFLREWLPEGDDERDQALIGAIGASDPLQLDGLGGGSSLNSKLAIVSRSSQPDCDLDYLFVDVTQWYALFAPAGASAELLARLNALLNQVLADPQVAGRIESHGASSPARRSCCAIWWRPRSCAGRAWPAPAGWRRNQKLWRMPRS